MKNKIIDVTQMGSRITTHELSKVESPDPVKRGPLLKIKEGITVRVVFNFLLLTVFTMGFGISLAIALVAVGPIHEWVFQLALLGMVVAEVFICSVSIILYKYMVKRLKEDEDSTDTGPTKHPSDLADRCMSGEGKDIIG